MLRRILKSLGTYFYHNKTMCRVDDPVPYVKGQGHKPRSSSKNISGNFFSGWLCYATWISLHDILKYYITLELILFLKDKIIFNFFFFFFLLALYSKI